MRYELARLESMGALYTDHPNHYVRHVALKDAVVSLPDVRNVLVLGCGRGWVEYLLPAGMRITSVDISPVQIAAAREINRWKIQREFVVGDIYDLPESINGRTFDLTVISETIEHVEDDAAVLRLAYERTRPGGYFVLTVPNRQRFHNTLLAAFGRKPFMMSADHLREYSAREARTVLEQAGFEVIRWRGAWFEFPRGGSIEPWIGPLNPIRRVLAWLFPRWSTYLLFVCRRREQAA